MTKHKQNEVWRGFLEKPDLAKRESLVLEEASRLLGYQPTRLMGRSAWWGSSEIGAFHYFGQFEGIDAVIKIQGVKPVTSEAFMIESFAKYNESQILRPPKIYAKLPWSEERKYEAIVMEFIDGKGLVSLPTNETELDYFFRIFSDYRANCRNTPWLYKPEETISKSIETNFEKWRQTSLEIYPDHPLREENDWQLIKEAVKVLAEVYSGVEREFVHGHISDGDLLRCGNQVVVTSNLFWSWRPPFYDAIFAFHWHRYHLSDVLGITADEIEKQKKLWLSKIEETLELKSAGSRRLFAAALLERAAAGLNLDALAVSPDNPVARHLVSSTRDEVVELTRRLSSLK